MRHFVTAIILCAGGCALFPTTATACNVQNQSRLSITLEGALQKDPLQANVGDSLYVKRASLSNLSHQRQDISCVPTPAQEQLSVTGSMTGNMIGDHIYPTSVAGIGIRLSLLIHQNGHHTPVTALPFTDQFALDNKNDLTSDDIFLKTELVKTGPIASSEHIHYQSPSVLTLKHTAQPQVMNVDFSFNATAPAGYCYFNATSATFNLIPVDAAELLAQHTLATTPLDTAYTCSGSPSHVEMTVYGVAENTSQGILKNMLKANNATGVGVQLLYRNMPLVLGSPISLDDLPLVNNQSAIPLAARYIALKPQITAGNIETLATIKLNFL